MKRSTFLKFAAAAAVATLLAGCATGPKYGEVASRMAPLTADQGRIVFMRSANAFGSGVQPELKLNGQVVGQSKPGGFFWVDRPAGNYTVSAATEVERTLTLSLAAGETKYVRSSVSMGLFIGRVQFELESPDKARAELPELSYTGK